MDGYLGIIEARLDKIEADMADLKLVNNDWLMTLKEERAKLEKKQPAAEPPKTYQEALDSEKAELDKMADSDKPLAKKPKNSSDS